MPYSTFWGLPPALGLRGLLTARVISPAAEENPSSKPLSKNDLQREGKKSGNSSETWE